jgi:drug/metabolite transporter (DMT)-like permease
MSGSRLSLTLFIAILAVSTASIFIREAQQDASSIVIAAIRLSLASIILAPFALIGHRGDILSLTSRSWIKLVISGIFLAIHFATWITSLEYTTVLSSVVLVSTGPLWVALLSPIFLGEMPSRWVWGGMFIALLGGIIIGISDSCGISIRGDSCSSFTGFTSGSSVLGNTLALIGALSVAVYLMIGRNLRSNINLIPYIFLVYGIAAITLLVVMFAIGETPFGLPGMTYFWMLCLALIPQLIGHSSYNWALRYLPASLVSITTLGEPVGSAILAFFFLGEKPTPISLVGGILILVGIYLSTRKST